MNLVRAITRNVLAAPFIIDGLDAMIHPARHVERFQEVTPALEKLGLPPILDSDATLMARASGAAAVVAGLGLATGKAPRSCAAFLAAMNIPLTVINNPVWKAKGHSERSLATRGMLGSAAIGAGLTMAALDRQGKPSLAWKREQARLAKAAQQAA